MASALVVGHAEIETVPVREVGPVDAAIKRLLGLPSGGHCGASADGGCWVMIGRDLRDVATWSIVPPAASLTLA